MLGLNRVTIRIPNRRFRIPPADFGYHPGFRIPPRISDSNPPRLRILPLDFRFHSTDFGFHPPISDTTQDFGYHPGFRIPPRISDTTQDFGYHLFGFRKQDLHMSDATLTDCRSHSFWFRNFGLTSPTSDFTRRFRIPPRISDTTQDFGYHPGFRIPPRISDTTQDFGFHPGFRIPARISDTTDDFGYRRRFRIPPTIPDSTF